MTPYSGGPGNITPGQIIYATLLWIPNHLIASLRIHWKVISLKMYIGNLFLMELVAEMDSQLSPGSCTLLGQSGTCDSASQLHLAMNI